MHKVFISGSMHIKNLDENVLGRLDNIIKANYKVIVGDANGVDRSIQEYLHEKRIPSVEVYCAGSQPRNNLGHWVVNKIHSDAKPGTRQFHTAKDLVMAEDCDYGLMVWDTKSTGTLSNAIELLKRKKKSLVYINNKREFMAVKEAGDLEILISFMSDAARSKAEIKLDLQKKIDSIKNEQESLFNTAH